MKRFSLRTLFWWLAPSAGVGTLGAQSRPANEFAVVDTISQLPSHYLKSPPLVRVFLPPGYERSRRTYRLLLSNDGQDMEALGLASTLENLLAAEEIEPVIVVAIHAGEHRLDNYGTAGVPNAQGLGAGAGNYERFLIAELLPQIRRRYRIGPGPAAIMGWSLGGLSAFDLAWRRSDTFGSVGVFSGAFWWRTDDSTVPAKQASRIMHRRVRETSRTPTLRIWLEAGTEDELEDRDQNGVIDAIQDTRELIDEITRKGMREAREVMYVEVDGGHNPETWARALPDFLRWAFGRQADSN